MHTYNQLVLAPTEREAYYKAYNLLRKLEKGPELSRKVVDVVPTYMFNQAAVVIVWEDESLLQAV